MPRELVDELRQLLVTALRLPRSVEQISPQARLFGGELGLDSVDAVELALAVEKRYRVIISDGDLARFPLSTLADFAELLRAKGAVAQETPPESDAG
jgi:acyl carrier protein